MRSRHSYPPEVKQEARRLFCEIISDPQSIGGVRRRTGAEVAFLVNDKYPDHPVSRQTIQSWASAEGWVNQIRKTAEQPQPAAPPPAAAPEETDPTGEASPPELLSDEEWNWNKKKMKVLTTLAGLTESCFAAAREKMSGEGRQYAFKDAESAIKTGLAALETFGKVQSGRFDVSSDGDMLPPLSRNQVNLLIAVFENPDAPVPVIPRKAPQVVEVTAEDVTSDG